MKRITESELLARVQRLENILALHEAPGQPGYDEAGTKINPDGTPGTPVKTAAPAAAPAASQGGRPKVNYEKDFPAATAMELQKKLNAAGEKLAVDGKMGPATRAAMARHPEITSDPNAQQNQPAAAPAAAAAGDGSAAPAAAPKPPEQSAMNQASTNMGAAIAAAGGEGGENTPNRSMAFGGGKGGGPATTGNGLANAPAGLAAPPAPAGMEWAEVDGVNKLRPIQQNAGQQAVNQTNKDVLGAIQKQPAGNQTAAGSEFGTDATFAAANAQNPQGGALTRGMTAGGQGGQPAAAPAAALTPDQQKWLGGANPQDPYILSRMPGANQIPVSYFKDPKDQKIASGRGMPFAKESAESDGQLLTADPALARIVSLINYGK
jgi:hypothetical protein